MARVPAWLAFGAAAAFTALPAILESLGLIGSEYVGIATYTVGLLTGAIALFRFAWHYKAFWTMLLVLVCCHIAALLALYGFVPHWQERFQLLLSLLGLGEIALFMSVLWRSVARERLRAMSARKSQKDG